mmetsp:Transcript_43677/g.74584  ORF Transcript_43677/g.74584 Transcript_43677/m.74584 type:complete len:121 (-) Transcript_43677:158-520(-)
MPMNDYWMQRQATMVTRMERAGEEEVARIVITIAAVIMVDPASPVVTDLEVVAAVAEAGGGGVVVVEATVVDADLPQVIGEAAAVVVVIRVTDGSCRVKSITNPLLREWFTRTHLSVHMK